MGFYAQVIVPLLCDFGLDRPFVARYRRNLLAHASGNISEAGLSTGPPWQGRSTVLQRAAEVYLILCEVDLPRLPHHHGWRPPAQTLERFQSLQVDGVPALEHRRRLFGCLRGAEPRQLLALLARQRPLLDRRGQADVRRQNLLVLPEERLGLGQHIDQLQLLGVARLPRLDQAIPHGEEDRPGPDSRAWALHHAAGVMAGRDVVAGGLLDLLPAPEEPVGVLAGKALQVEPTHLIGR